MPFKTIKLEEENKGIESFPSSSSPAIGRAEAPQVSFILVRATWSPQGAMPIMGEVGVRKIYDYMPGVYVNYQPN